MRRCRSNRRVVLALAAMVVVAGCRATPTQRPVLPAVVLESSAVDNVSPATAPAVLPTTTSHDRPGTVGIEVTWAVVARAPLDALDPLDARATLVSAPLAGGPVLTAGRQTAAARFGQGDDANELLRRVLARADGSAAQVGYQTAVVTPGSTTTFRLTTAAEAKRPPRSATLSISLPSVAAPPSTQPTSSPATAPATQPSSAPATQADSDAVPVVQTPPAGSMTVTLEGFRDTAGVDVDAPATRPAFVTTPETAYLDGLPLTPGARYALVLPGRFESSPWRGIVVFIDVTPPADAPELAEALAGRPAATRPATQAAVTRTLMRAVDALRTTADPRPPLLYLATATRATIAADAVLLADESILNRLRSALLQYVKEHDVTDGVALGWHLDRSAVLAMCEAQQANTLPPEMAAVLTVHGGDVGRQAGAMIDAVNNVGSSADLKARLIGENTIALEDNSPAVRVRAFDWLKAQGRAPDGYDPLADARARSAAINRSISTTQGTR